MSNYIVVLFKNKKKRKIIKRYLTEKNAVDSFKELVNKNQKILFDKKIENATPVDYHIGLLTNQSSVQNTLYFVDDLGRNHVANLQDKTEFTIRADIQQTKAPHWKRMMAGADVGEHITILAPINGNNKLLVGGNIYAVVFHGIEYVITEVLDAGRQGFMKYIAVAQIQG